MTPTQTLWGCLVPRLEEEIKKEKSRTCCSFSFLRNNVLSDSLSMTFDNGCVWKQTSLAWLSLRGKRVSDFDPDPSVVVSPLEPHIFYCYSLWKSSAPSSELPRMVFSLCPPLHSLLPGVTFMLSSLLHFVAFFVFRSPFPSFHSLCQRRYHQKNGKSCLAFTLCFFYWST